MNPLRLQGFATVAVVLGLLAIDVAAFQMASRAFRWFEGPQPIALLHATSTTGQALARTARRAMVRQIVRVATSLATTSASVPASPHACTRGRVVVAVCVMRQAMIPVIRRSVPL